MTPIDETPEWSDLVRSATPPIPEDCITRRTLSWEELEERYNNLRQLYYGTTPWANVSVLYHESTGNVEFVLPDGRVWGGAWGVRIPPKPSTEERYGIRYVKNHKKDWMPSQEILGCAMPGWSGLWTSIFGFIVGAALMWCVMWGLFG